MNIVYDTFFNHLLNGDIDFDTDTIKVALFQNTYNPLTTSESWADISGFEITPVDGYVAGGQDLGIVSVTDKKITVSNAVWTTTETITASYAVVYKDETSDGEKYLICCIDFADNRSITAGDFTIQFNTTGLLNFEVG